MPLEVRLSPARSRMSPARSYGGRLSPYMAFPSGWGITPREGDDEQEEEVEQEPLLHEVSCKDRVAQCWSGRWVAWYYGVCILATLALIGVTVFVGWDEDGGTTSIVVFSVEVVLTTFMVVEAFLRTWLMGCQRSMQSAWHIIDCIACLLVLSALVLFFDLFHQDSWEQIILAIRFSALGARAIVLLHRHRTFRQVTGASADIILPGSSLPQPSPSSRSPLPPTPTSSIAPEGGFGASLGKLASFTPLRA